MPLCRHNPLSWTSGPFDHEPAHDHVDSPGRPAARRCFDGVAVGAVGHGDCGTARGEGVHGHDQDGPPLGHRDPHGSDRPGRCPGDRRGRGFRGRDYAPPAQPRPSRRARPRGRRARRRRSTAALAGHPLRPSLRQRPCHCKVTLPDPRGRWTRSRSRSERPDIGNSRPRARPPPSRRRPRPGRPPGSPPRPGSTGRLSGITALVPGGLMLLCIVLPQQWKTTPTVDNDPIKATYLLYLGVVVLGLGTLALRARWRIQGLGALIGASIIGTVVFFDMVNTLDERGLSGMDVGFWVAFVAPVVLLVSGGLALAGARRETDLGFAPSVALGLGLLVRRRARGRWGADPSSTGAGDIRQPSRMGPSGTLGGGAGPVGAGGGGVRPPRPARPMGALRMVPCLRSPSPRDMAGLGGEQAVDVSWHVVRPPHPRRHGRPGADGAPRSHSAPKGLTAIRPWLLRNWLDPKRPQPGDPHRAARRLAEGGRQGQTQAVPAHRHPAPWIWKACWRAAGGGAD